METKVCKQCNVEKSVKEYYTQSNYKLFGKCKDCIKQNVRANRAEKIDYYREYDRRRANNPDRVEGRLAYSATPEGIASHNAAKKRWSASNAIKRGASYMVNNAVRDGKLSKPNECAKCGIYSKRLEGHHYDYAKPLEVTWLCSKCHRSWHKINKPLNGE